MTDEQRREACDAIRNFSLSRMMSNTAKQAFHDLMAEEERAARAKAASKLHGLIKKPEFP